MKKDFENMATIRNKIMFENVTQVECIRLTQIIACDACMKRFIINTFDNLIKNSLTETETNSYKKILKYYLDVYETMNTDNEGITMYSLFNLLTPEELKLLFIIGLKNVVINNVDANDYKVVEDNIVINAIHKIKAIEKNK